MAATVGKWQVVAVVMFAVLCVSVGEGLLKMGMTRIGAENLSGVRLFLRAASTPQVLVGTLLMAVYFGLYLLALSWADFSFVLPLTAASYLFGALFARFILHEDVSPVRWIGNLLIMSGVAVVGIGSRK
jgi:drug/metabolite transporter (DMT)-like permease